MRKRRTAAAAAIAGGRILIHNLIWLSADVKFDVGKEEEREGEIRHRSVRRPSLLLLRGSEWWRIRKTKKTGPALAQERNREDYSRETGGVFNAQPNELLR